MPNSVVFPTVQTVHVSAKGAPVRLRQRLDHEIEKIQGSRFITTLLPAQSSDDVTVLQAELRAAHPHSRHVCFAYVGTGDQESRFSDDGEPSKTAGLPMLRVLLGACARHTGALVVRYFGGTKLGTGGLVRAYTAAVREAVERAEWEPVEALVRCRLRCVFAMEPSVRHQLDRADVSALATYDAMGATLEFVCPAAKVAELTAAVGARPGGDVELLEPQLPAADTS